MSLSSAAAAPWSASPPTPHVADDTILTPARWSIFAAIADTVVPSLTASPDPVKPDPLRQLPVAPELFEDAVERVSRLVDAGAKGPVKGSKELSRRYWSESATMQPEFRESVQRLLGLYVDPTTRGKLLGVLDVLSTRPGSLLLTGHVTPMDKLSIEAREKILQGWAAARLQPFRDIHTSLTSMVKLFWLRTSPTLGQVLDYPRLPEERETPHTSFPFEFLQFTQCAAPETIETDVVIVGSGCGGAVAASVLAQAGLRVIVVDKSYFWAPEHLPMSERDAAVQLFDNGGLIQSDDGKTAIIAGSTWGGGGTINWSASLHTQGFVRREWADKFGMPYFASSAFQADLDAVCERMGVPKAVIEHNKTNSLLLDGARRLGWSAKTVPQNTGEHAHPDGYCTLGCWSGGKQGPTSTFLPDAANAGAQFIEGYEVAEVLFHDDGLSSSPSRIVRGVKGTWLSRDGNGGVEGADRVRKELIIKAPRVIVSSGTLRSPLLLLRSGLKNKHIGRHLHLHPVSCVGATWDDDVKPWQGGILTSVVSEFENQDGAGYGAKLEACTMLPGWFLPNFPWQSGVSWKHFAASMRRMTGYIALARDRYGGRVYPDPADPFRLRIAYSPHPKDRVHILTGVVALAQLFYVAGAREIFSSIPGVPSFLRPSTSDSHTPPSINDPAFQSWLARLRSIGLPADAGFASAHQMGTCRMRATQAGGVVDPQGKVWGTEGLYVADASVFPSASGVNPMVTTMGIARGIARGLVREVVGVEGRARL